MNSFHVYDIAATSLLVATKVEECTRRIKDIVIVCAQKAQKNDKAVLEENSKDFLKWKETLLHFESILLETLCFDLTVQQPHNHLEKLAEQLRVSSSAVRKAWMLLYQCLGSPVCVLYKPDVVAAAVLLLASHFSSTDKLSENWYEALDDDVDASEVHGRLQTSLHMKLTSGYRISIRYVGILHGTLSSKNIQSIIPLIHSYHQPILMIYKNYHKY
ncbi:unnamed protein product [Rhizopus stolonifer]